MSGFPRPVDAELTAPLELPAVPGKPLTTQGGNTLDDGSGNVIVGASTSASTSMRIQGSLPLTNAGNVPILAAYATGLGLMSQGAGGAGAFFILDSNRNLNAYFLADGTFTTQGHVNPGVSTPALPANPPVSGTVYQNTTGGPIIITVPITATAVGGSGQWALGSTNTPSDWGGAEDIGVDGETHNMTLFVPNNWYWSLTVTNATIGTASVLGQ